LCVILSLLFTQSITVNGPAAANTLAEHQTYLPFVLRELFLPSSGELDASFGGDGMATFEWGKATAAVWQPDDWQGGVGRIVVASSRLIWCILADGSLDNTFGSAGSMTPAEVWSEDVLVQDDGQIVTGGYMYVDQATDFALARINPDGSLDTSFDEDGWLTTDFSEDYDYGRSIVLQPDGKIVLGGHSEDASYHTYFALARYNPDGSLDTGFGDNGKVLTDLAYGGELRSLALQPDGKIVAAGSVHNGQDSDFGLARYNPDGSLDTTFDGDGLLTTDFGGSSDEGARDVLLQPDGKLLAAGSTNGPSSADIALARYNPDGSLDTSFDEDGLVVTHLLGVGEIGQSLALQPDGKILLAGYADVLVVDPMNPDSDFVLARYNADGSLDTTFDGDGWLTTDIESRDDEALALIPQPDGKIVLAGGSGSYLALVRYK
jgi:uncharacterized delta-60 repeat protein